MVGLKKMTLLLRRFSANLSPTSAPPIVRNKLPVRRKYHWVNPLAPQLQQLDHSPIVQAANILISGPGSTEAAHLLSMPEALPLGLGHLIVVDTLQNQHKSQQCRSTLHRNRYVLFDPSLQLVDERFQVASLRSP